MEKHEINLEIRKALEDKSYTLSLDQQENELIVSFDTEILEVQEVLLVVKYDIVHVTCDKNEHSYSDDYDCEIDIDPVVVHAWGEYDIELSSKETRFFEDDIRCEIDEDVLSELYNDY